MLALVKTVVGQQQEEELGMAQLEADAKRDLAVRSAEEAVEVPSNRIYASAWSRVTAIRAGEAYRTTTWMRRRD